MLRLLGAVAAGITLTAGFVKPSIAQEHPVQSLVWPADLAAPVGETWISPRSVGPAKDYFRAWAAQVNATAPTVDVDVKSAWPTESTIIETVVTRDGRLRSARVLRSSGIARFDAFVMEGVRASAAFPPPPVELMQGRDTVSVIGLFGATYAPKPGTETMLRGTPHASEVVLLQPHDAKAWQSFYAEFLPALQKNLVLGVPKPHAAVRLTIFLETSDSRIQATQVQGKADQAFKDAVLAHARAFASDYRTPGDRDVAPMIVTVSFDAARSSSQATELSSGR